MLPSIIRLGIGKDIRYWLKYFKKPSKDVGIILLIAIGIGLVGLILASPFILTEQSMNRNIATIAVTYKPFKVGQQISCNTSHDGVDGGKPLGWQPCTVLAVSDKNRYYTCQYLSPNTNRITDFKFADIYVGEN